MLPLPKLNEGATNLKGCFKMWQTDALPDMPHGRPSVFSSVGASADKVHHIPVSCPCFLVGLSLPCPVHATSLTPLAAVCPSQSRRKDSCLCGVGGKSPTACCSTFFHVPAGPVKTGGYQRDAG